MLIRFSLIFLIALKSSFSFTQCKIIPYPWKSELSAEKLMLTSFKIDTTNLNPTNFIFLKDELKARFNVNLDISKKDVTIQFEIGKAVNEAYYRIDIGDKVSLSSMTDKGQFYAINSFLQLLEQSNEGIYLYNGIIEDYPKFEWRGLHLDVSRHFFTVDEVKRFIDLMAYYKFNTFHWHLTDDQGWRIEIKKYPKLTEIGAWRDSTVNHHYSTKPRTYTVEKYGGFYTQAQIKEVVEYASKKYITVVPEIELPGHSRAALAAYPEFRVQVCNKMYQVCGEYLMIFIVRNQKRLLF
jgi:hexosaminidase